MLPKSSLTHWPLMNCFRFLNHICTMRRLTIDTQWFALYFAHHFVLKAPKARWDSPKSQVGLYICLNFQLSAEDYKSTWHTEHYSSKLYSNTPRLVVYKDFKERTGYWFLTNNYSLEAITISELNRDRWHIYIFFKWIKQHLHIKTFFGTSRNAVFTQIWIARWITFCSSSPWSIMAWTKSSYNIKPYQTKPLQKRWHPWNV